MTREQHIAAIREILRDCGETNDWGENVCVVKYAGVDTTIVLTAGNMVVVTDDECGLFDHIEAYAPFEVEGMYEALLKKYKK